MNISLMVLDNNPLSREKISNVINNMSENTSVHNTDNFREAISTVNRYKINVIIINISSIDVDKYVEDCIQLRNIYSFAPILAISSDSNPSSIEHYNYIGFDDILDIEIITSTILARVIQSAIQRSKNYHVFHTTNQRKLVSSRLLKLLLDKKSLINVAQSSADIINSQNLNATYSSASIYIIEEDKVERIAHSGSEDSEDSIFEFQKKAFSLKHSNSDLDEFNYLKKTDEDSKNTSLTIPLKNKNNIFAFLKIETEQRVVHPSEERRYYQDISTTLSDVFKLAQERERFEQVYEQNVRLIDEMSSAAIGIDKHDRVTHWNHQAEEYFTIIKPDALNQSLFNLNINCDWPIIIEKLYDSLNNKITTDRFDVSYRRVNEDKERVLSVAITPFVEPNGSFSGYLLLLDDITEKKHMEKRHQQSIYLESIGQLSAGIAHEINTPMQYISDNLSFLQESFTDTAKALRTIKKTLLANALDLPKLDEIFEEADFEYLSEELPMAFKQTTEGVNRVCTIVKAMKEYSHPNSEEKVATDINNCIESTITISKHTWKYHSEMITDLAPELPEVMCHPGPLNEVILNIIVNAADAIREYLETDASQEKGEIKVQTLKLPDYAEIRISDSGGGIPQEIQEKIFDQFFTTKEVGKGTGQGLALSYSIIKERHDGELYFETELGKGTTFVIQLPYK